MIRLNFIPAHVLHHRQRRRRLMRLAVAAAACGALSMVPLSAEGIHAARAGDLNGQYTRLSAELRDAQSKLAQTRSRAQNLRARLDRTNALRGKRGWAPLLAMIIRHLPQDVWLTALATDPVRPVGTGVATVRRTPSPVSPSPSAGPQEPVAITIEGPVVLVIDGYAAEHGVLWEFIQRLKQEEVFSDVTLARSGVEPVLSGVAVRFRILCQW